jgi:hypothetical protein
MLPEINFDSWLRFSWKGTHVKRTKAGTPLVLFSGILFVLSGCASENNPVWNVGSGKTPHFFHETIQSLSRSNWVRRFSDRNQGRAPTFAVYLVSTRSSSGAVTPYSQGYEAGPFTVQDTWYDHAVSTAHAIRWNLYDSFVQDLVDHGFRVVTVTRRNLLSYERLYAMQHARSRDIPNPGHIYEANEIIVMKLNEGLPTHLSRHVASVPLEIQVINLESNLIRYSTTGSVRYVVQ